MKRPSIAAALALGALLLGGCAAQRTQERALANDAQFGRFVIVTVRNEPPRSPPRAGASIRTYVSASAYAVAPLARDAARALAAAYALREADAWPIGMLGVHCIVFEIPADAARDDVIDRLRRDRRVESVQPLQSFTSLSSQDASGQHASHYRRLQRNLDVMQADAAHRWSRGAGVRIGVIDSRVDAAHPDLTGRIVQQKDLVGGASAEQSDRHGTAVAGVIAATGRSERGVIGIAPDAELYALRACWPRADDPSRAVCSSFTLAKGLVAAIDAQLQIVNLSLAGPPDPLLSRIVEIGLKQGVVFVGAAPAGDPLASFPTNIEGVIAANASGARNSADASAHAQLFAPATDVLTLTPGGRYDFMSGSSLAAASIAGGAALLLARDRTLRASDIHRLLDRSMQMSEGVGVSVNLCRALAVVVEGVGC